MNKENHTDQAKKIRDLEARIRELEATTQQYENFFNNTPLPFQSLDKDGFILQVNTLWLHTLGYARNEVIGCSFEDFLHPDLKPHFRINFPNFKKKGVIHDVHFRMRHKSGYYIDVAFEGCIGYREDGSFKQTYCIFKDITQQKKIEDELKANEEKFRKIYHRIPVMIHSINSEGKILDVSNHWLEKSGYTRKEVIGKKSTDFLTEESRKFANKQALPEFFEKGYADNVYYQFVKKNGEIIDVLLSAISETDSQGNFIRSIASLYDITDYKKTEKKLWESEARFKAIFYQDQLVKLLINPDTLFIEDANPAAAKFYGYSIDELKKMKISEINQLDVDNVKKEISDAIGRTKNYFNFKHKLSNGEIRDVEVYSSPVEFGNQSKLLSFVLDITEEKKFREALRESEEKFHSLFNASPDAILLADANDGIIKDANPAAEKLFELPAHELIGKNQQQIHPKDQRKQAKESFYQIRPDSKGPPDPLEIEILTAKGNKRSVEIRGSKIIISNKKYILGTFRDITDRKIAEQALKDNEEKFRTFINHSNDAIRLTDEKGKIIFVNQAHEQLIGYSAEELIGMNTIDFLFKMLPTDRQTNARYNQLEKLIDNVQNGKNHKIFNKPFIIAVQTKSGDIIQLQESIFQINTSKGIRFGSIVRDITKLKRQENQLRQLNATKDKFFSIISHDLRNPFNAILGFSQLANESIRKGNYSKLEKYCTQIHTSAQLSYNLLNNLLQWSRIQRGKIEYNPEKMDLTEITNETIKLFSLNLSQKNIALEANLPPNIELTADKFMMQTILRNLLSNAIKYTHNDGKITLSASREPQSIKISIHDTGVGISPSNMEKLFRIETSYSTAGTNKEQGTGLGLILCKEFVEKHGGSIWVESSLGKGTSFHFTIPT